MFNSLDPWNCAKRAGDEYANVAYNFDWINDKKWEHEQFTYGRQISGSIKLKSHLYTLLLMTWINLLQPAYSLLLTL